MTVKKGNIHKSKIRSNVTILRQLNAAQSQTRYSSVPIYHSVSMLS